MESNKFDALARRAVGDDSSRRGVLRAGIGALAASALAVVGLSAVDDAAAKKNNNNGKNHQRDKATRRRHATTVICYLGQTMEVKKKNLNQKFPGFTQGACICQEPTPLTCGIGCCATAFPLCCPSGSFGSEPGQSSGSTCAPTNARCCPPNQGGGACAGELPQCCPLTNQDPRGSCAPVDANCCNSAAGGGFCQQPFNQCCPVTPQFPGGACCRPSQRCGVGAVGTQGNCLPGQVINFRGCCSSAINVEADDDGGVKGSSAKVGVAAV